MMIKQHAKAATIDVAINDTVMVKALERPSKLTLDILGPNVITQPAHDN